MIKHIYKILIMAFTVLVLVPSGVWAVEDDYYDMATILTIDLYGEVSIIDDGTPQYGDIISADVSAITNNTGTLSYQWTRNGTNIYGSVSASYTLVQDDIGANIGVKVTSSAETGTITSETVLASKADRLPPSSPQVDSKDHYNIILQIVAGCEYKTEGGSFAVANTFTDLKSNTEYIYYQRYAETVTHNASPSSEGLHVTTEYLLLTNTTYNISNLKSGDGVLISGSVTLYGTQNIRIKCNPGTKLTLQNATINVSGMVEQCGVEFVGSGNQLILSGSNKVYSGNNRAGIETTGSLIISGSGSLYAKGGTNGAGVGGGDGQNLGSLNITGGIITAIAGTNAAGIGGGSGGNGGTVNITGGLVFASGSNGDDIGGGNSGSVGLLSLSGGSALFLRNNLSPALTTSTHSFYSNETVTGGAAYGYSLPSLWLNGITAYAYIDYCVVTFETNGAASIDSKTIGKMSLLVPPAEPARTGLIFDGWYSESVLINSFDFDGERVYSNMTLYAKWNAKVTINSGEGGGVTPSEEVYVQLDGDLIIECEPEENYIVDTVKSSKKHIVTDDGDNTYTIENISASDTITVSFKCTILLGTVTIDHDSTPECREKVGVNTTKVENNISAFKYQWTRDGENISGATGETYILAQEDVGHKVGVKVTSTEKEGFLSDEIAMKVEKAMKAAPRPPELLEKTISSVALKIVEGCEYKIDEGEWQKSNIFTELDIETEYSFYQRYALSSTHKASNQSFSLKITTYGFNVEMIDIGQDALIMKKGDIEDIISIMKYFIYPEEAKNKDVLWNSSNKKVAIIDNETGIITALDVGKTVITVTAKDTKNGVFSDVCIIQVYDESAVEANAYMGEWTGILIDEDGNLLSGYYITLYSNPITCQTNSLGKYKFEYIPYASHTLVVENRDNEEIGRFIIDMTLGEKQGAIIDDNRNIVNIVYTSITESIDIPIEINSTFDNIKIDSNKGITFIGDEITEVLSKKLYVLILMGIIAACIIGVGYVLYIGRIQGKKDADDEIVTVDSYEQILIEEASETNSEKPEAE